MGVGLARSRRRVRAARLAALLALLSAALTASATAAGAAAPRMTATPATLVLGTGATCEIALEGEADLPEPRLSASVGTLEPATRLGPGRWKTRYTPPAKRYPQVAIVAALFGRGRQAHVAIPLFGQGEAVIKTKPRARIDAVRIGDRTFGPATADEKGVASVPVIVPPGVEKAFNGAQAIDLGLPQTVHFHVALERSSADADQAATLQGFVWAVTPEGAPRDGAQVELTASRGEAVAGAAAGPGVLPVTWTLPPGPRETTQLTVRLKAEPELARAISVTRASGHATKLTLTFDRERVLAGETELRAKVVAVDAQGNPASPRFTLTASLGTAEPPREVSSGTFESRIAVPEAFGGKTSLEVTVAGEDGQALASAAVPLLPGEALLSLEPRAAQADADGYSKVEIKVKAQDRFGNAAGVPQARALLGEAKLEPVAEGEWTLRYETPRRTEAADDTVTVSLGNLVEKGTVSLVPRTQGLEAALKLGFIGNGTLAGAWLAAEGGFHFTIRGEVFAALIEASWVQYSTQVALDDGLKVNGHHDFFSPIVSVAYRRAFGKGGRWIFNLGVGVGFSQVWSTLQAGDQPAQSETGSAFCYEGTVGIERVLWRGGAFLELRYLRNGHLGTPSLRGQLGTILMDIGYRYDAF
ncbi:MAG TPA: hypothetical protein VGK67_09760 [Myxococcales bacterium]